MSGRERTMLIVLGVIVVLGLAYVFLFVLGGEEPQPEETAPTQVSSPPPPPAPGIGVEEPTEQPPRAVTFFGGRDPFTPLVVAQETGGGGTGDGTDGDGTTDGTTPPSDDGSTDGGTTPPSDGDPTDEDGIAVTGRPVVLVDVVDEESAQVQVEGAPPITVTEGQRFARRYRIVSVEANCARFLFGDESFSLCQGMPPE